MNIKRKRILRVILPMLLIISFLSQSVVSLAEGELEISLSDMGNKHQENSANIGKGTPDGHTGWLISIQEVDNKYLGQGGSYTECALSIWNEYLYDYPTEYVYDCATNANKYAYMDWRGNNDKYSSSQKLYIMNAQGYPSSSTVANIYDTQTYYNNASSFTSSAQLIETNSYYETIRELLEKRELTYEYLKAAGVEANINSAIKSFVGLWYKSENADDILKEFVFDDSLDYYEKLIRYLDLLLIVNAMCNNAYDDYIDDFCYNYNQDYSPKFVTILVAATITARGENGVKGLFTLPNWYSWRAQGTVGVDALLHTDGVGGNNPTSTAVTTDNWASVKSAYNNNAKNVLDNKFTSDTYASDYWWDGKKAALSVYPTGPDGSNPGNVGYTYISTGDLKEIDPIDPPSNTSSSSSGGGSGSGSVDSIQNLIDRIDLEFYISVESDEYMLRATESGGDVDQQQVTVTIF